MACTLHDKGYQSASMLVEYKKFSLDEDIKCEGSPHPDDHLGVDKAGQYAYRVMGNGYLYVKVLEKTVVTATDNGDSIVAKSAGNLLDMWRTCQKAKKETFKKQWFGEVIKDAKVIQDLNALLPIQKGKEDKADENGYWGIATVEQIDSDGDIIMVDGIQHSVDPEKNKTMPLLAGHKKSLPDGSPPEVGIVKHIVKTTYEGKKSLAFYFSFCLDAEGKPLDELVNKYYSRYKMGYTGSFSIGGEALEEPERIDTGLKYNKTSLYEISMVSVPANKDALAITRSLSDEDMELLKSLNDQVASLAAQVSKFENTLDLSVAKHLKPFESRFDLMEALMVTKDLKPKGKDKGAERSLSELVRETFKG